MAKRDYEKGALPFGFVPIPKDVLAMPEFLQLPCAGKALMLTLIAQYNGKNNGRLCPAFDVVARDGWTSKGTVHRAKLALLAAPFVVLTRKGHAPRTAEWLAFTWWKLDFEKSMDVDPRTFPYLNFLRLQIADPNTERTRPGKRNVSPRNGTDRTSKVVLSPPEMRPMGGAK